MLSLQPFIVLGINYSKEFTTMYTVYAITNQINGKKYIGVTRRDPFVRYKEHICLANSDSLAKIHCAMRKHGVENFKLEILESNVPDELAGQKEQEYILKYNSFYHDGHGYNVNDGGRGNVGYIFTDEAKHKISVKFKGYVFPESRNLKIKEAMTGREYKQEWRDALSKSRLGRFTKEENPFYGKHHSDSTKSIIGDKNTKHHVLQLDPTTLEVIQKFKNSAAAGEWVVAHRLTSAKPSTCAGRIDEVCRLGGTHHIAYTYKWRYEEKSID